MLPDVCKYRSGIIYQRIKITHKTIDCIQQTLLFNDAGLCQELDSFGYFVINFVTRHDLILIADSRCLLYAFSKRSTLVDQIGSENNP